MSASTWDSRCDGSTLDADTVEQILREYQEETCTKFVVKKKEKLYGSSADGRLWLSGLTIVRAFFRCYEIDDAKLLSLTWYLLKFAAHLREYKKFKILFNSIKSEEGHTRGPTIKWDGTPYIHVASKVFECH